MPQPHVIDISRLIEEQKPGAFAVRIIVLLGLVMLTEGYDLGAMAFAAPAIGRDWELAKGALGPVFGAFVFGTMVGAIVFGYLGDRIGRKRSIMIGSLTLSVFTLATAWADTIDHLMILRFAAGVGIGGVIPNAISYITEFAPKRLRATWVTLMYTGYSIGTGLGGVVTAWLVPDFGWQIVFIIGGVAPILMVACLAFGAPESIRFLVIKGLHRGEVVRTLAVLRPDVTLPADARFVVADEAAPTKARLSDLFVGRLRAITPALWLVYIANAMALFFLMSWMPVLIEAVGMQADHAALVSAMFSVGGTVGGLVLMRFVDRYGALVITVLPLVGFPMVALLGVPMSDALLAAAVFVVGFCVIGTQFGLNAVAAMIYPTALRSRGTGTAIGVQKIGAISGPMIGGALLSAHLPVQQLFLICSLPVAVVAILSFVLGRLYRHNDEIA